MSLKTNNLTEALAILAKHHTSRITLNHIRHNDKFVPNAIPLVIHECCAAVINELIEAGFSLSMGKEGMHVDDYSKPNK